jgi:hypothetical protein
LGWENFLKGWICTEWCVYIKWHLAMSHIKKDFQKWTMKLIIALWDHIYRVWMYSTTVYHEENQGGVARYKQKALDRRMDSIWAKKEELSNSLLCTTFNQLTLLTKEKSQTYCKSKWCWANLAKLYLADAALPIRTEIYTITGL